MIRRTTIDTNDAPPRPAAVFPGFQQPIRRPLDPRRFGDAMFIGLMATGLAMNIGIGLAVGFRVAAWLMGGL
ncbi:hypothetical protein ACERK3_09570 [Phycisphaerales bacterium AB-hyl4]|uniref:Uncharacterized protein n=1 Tax=Natronomicrosphaera hydrolytica TaxID=3242702 RepID=A0ABV4U6T8_9BACT